MITFTKAIVLSSLKYRDHDLIVKCYTNQFGTVSYLLRGVSNSKKGLKTAAYYQPLSQLQLVVHHKTGRSLQSISEVKIDYLYHTIHSNVIKSSLVMFISEVLNQSLKEEEPNPELYQFLESSLQWLDHEEQYANFHLLFLLNLTKHLGCYPDVDHLEYPIFNLEEGMFSNVESKWFIKGEQVELLKNLIQTNFQDLPLLKVHSKSRLAFLQVLLTYYQLHLEGFKKPKSLEIFSQIFH